MLCLGIETSCDDTGLALVEDGKLVDSLLSSQAEVHAIFGGVVPELASREHSRRLGPIFDSLLARNRLTPSDIDLVAVARGPGLLGSLLAGVAFAKGLALTLGKPLLGVNHLHAHLLAAGLDTDLKFPALGLVISGGHTELYRMDGVASFLRLGRTLDDAAGEAFDKVGNVIGLSYPAGRGVDELAQLGERGKINFPLPYIHNDNLDFSFSGLKTTATKCAADLRIEARQAREKRDFCAALNEAVAQTLLIKAGRALDRHPDLDTMYIAGGVAANSAIRAAFEGLMARRKGRLLMPSLKFCMDNGAMIAFAGYLLAREGYFHGLDLEAIPRGRMIPDDMRRDQVGALKDD